MIYEANYSVRPAKKGELPAVLALINACGLYWDIGDSVENYEKKLVYDSESIIVADFNRSEIVGTTFFVYDPWSSFRWHTSVRKDHRGRGLGKLLINRTEEILRARGTTSVNAYVLESNINMLSIAKRLGYSRFKGSKDGLVVAIEKVLK